MVSLREPWLKRIGDGWCLKARRRAWLEILRRVD
jgi:hypothetical protein